MPLNNPLTYKWQGLDVGAQSPIVQNTWYNLTLDGIFKLLFFALMQGNTGADAEDLEVRVTIDGNAPITLALPACVSGTYYIINLDVPTGTLIDTAGDQNFFMRAEGDRRPLEAGHILIEWRQTSAVGLAPELNEHWSISRMEV